MALEQIQFSPPVTARRNDAMLERQTLLQRKLITGGYVEYPAKLMVKLAGQAKYTLHKEF